MIETLGGHLIVRPLLLYLLYPYLLEGSAAMGPGATLPTLSKVVLQLVGCALIDVCPYNMLLLLAYADVDPDAQTAMVSIVCTVCIRMFNVVR